jgi:hypothetical protein
MNYRKLQNAKTSNQILEYRYFNEKHLNEDVKFTMDADKEIKKLVDGKPEDLSQEEKDKIKLGTTTDDVKILAAIEKLNQKFGVK